MVSTIFTSFNSSQGNENHQKFIGFASADSITQGVPALRQLRLIVASRTLFIFLLAFIPWHTSAQTMNVSARITQPVDEKTVVPLPGNRHPLAPLNMHHRP